MKLFYVLCSLLAFAISVQRPAVADATDPTAAMVPAGSYTLDKTHASITFRVDHLGFSNYTARFKRFDARLQFDPADLAASSVTATIDPRSVDLDNPPPGFTDALLGEQWLDAAKFPEMVFHSTKAESTGASTLHMPSLMVFRPLALPWASATTSM